MAVVHVAASTSASAPEARNPIRPSLASAAGEGIQYARLLRGSLHCLSAYCIARSRTGADS